MPAAFWDSSALVPLCVRQGNTPQAIAFHGKFAVVVWWATQVEIASALARLLRTNHLTTAEWRQAGKLSSRLADSWSVIQPTENVRAKALHMIERYDLRAADAFQLAAANEWSQGNPHGRVFLTADDKMLQAAMLCGFDAKRV